MALPAGLFAPWRLCVRKRPEQKNEEFTQRRKAAKKTGEKCREIRRRKQQPR